MPQPVQIGWIDLGSRDKNKILSVLSLLYAAEAVDELGIGVIRDGFADVLFPGTSTVQTRAKYFLIVPFILMELERERNLTPRALLDRLAKEEIALISQLKKGNAEGVIGGRSGERLQKKPSSIYWNGLYTYGIFRSTVRLSLDEYAHAVCTLNRTKARITSAVHADRGEDTDDTGISSGIIGTFWRAPIPPPDWRERVTVELTKDEAQFLRDKIISSEHSKNSLLASILRSNSYEVKDYDDISLIKRMVNLPDDIRSDYEMAVRFSEFIYGANIRYNIILSNGENEDANEAWNEWYERVTAGFIQNYNVSEPFVRLSVSGRNRARIYPFVKQWKQVVIDGDVTAMDDLIIKREIQLKGKERAKLKNSGVYRWKEGVWLGGGKLQYRFRNARRLIADIYNGLEGNDSDVQAN